MSSLPSTRLCGFMVGGTCFHVAGVAIIGRYLLVVLCVRMATAFALFFGFLDTSTANL